MKRTALASFLLMVSAASALAQSSPGLTYGQIPTAGQWNSYFAAKQDTLGYTPVNKAGDVMTGRLVMAASTTLQASLNIPAGTAPTSPINGDTWTTTAGLFIRINGVTVGPLAGPSSGSFAATSPLTVSFPASVVTYAFDFSVANTFLASQTAQGATTTSPGWYTQVTGDTTPRVRVGLNATDIPSIAFGPGNAVRDAFLERTGAGALRHGAPDAAAPVAQTISVQNVVAGTSNTAGANLTISGSQGTGTGVGGSIIMQVAPAGSTGSTQNALSSALTINSAKLATFGGAVSFPSTMTYGGVTLTAAVTGTGKMVLDAAPTMSAVIVTGSFTATGLVTNADLVNASTTVNGTTCTLGSPCTITATATSITVGTTTIASGTSNGLLYNNAGTLGNLASANNGVLVTSGAGVPSIATTLPSGLTIPSPTLSGTLAGSITLSGNNTYSGTSLFTGGVPTLANGNASIAASSTAGGLFTGKGSVSDVTIQNSAGSAVATIATGTTTLNIVTLTLSNTISATYLPTGTAAAKGVVQCDGTTITCTAGVITAVGASATSITVGTTTIGSGTTLGLLYDNAGVLGNLATANGGVLNTSSAGVPSITITPVLGVAGSTVGTIAFANATSGTVKISPATGALGTTTWTLPGVTDQFVGLTTTDTLANKSLTSPAVSGTLSGSITLSGNNTYSGTATFNSTINLNGTTNYAGASGGVGNQYICFTNGSALLTASGSACGVSDERMKTITASFEPSKGLAAIIALRPVYYNWLDATSAKDGPQIGLVAQNVAAVLPELAPVSEDMTITLADGKKVLIPRVMSVDYPKMVVPLIAAVQELNSRIIALEKR